MPVSLTAPTRHAATEAQHEAGTVTQTRSADSEADAEILSAHSEVLRWKVHDRRH